MDDSKEIGARPVRHLLDGVAIEIRHGLIDEAEPVVLEDDDAEHRLLGEEPEPLLALSRALLSQLALGDLLEHAQDDRRAARSHRREQCIHRRCDALAARLARPDLEVPDRTSVAELGYDALAIHRVFVVARQRFGEQGLPRFA